MWTLAELAVGLAQIFGLATRLAALVCIGLNVSLMLIFGWMGSTCLDEWTMAVSGLAMSSAIFLAGGGTWSLDNLIGRSGWAQRNAWSAWIFSGPLPEGSVRAAALFLAAVAVVFTVGSYQILFGAVVSPQHARVDFHRHDIALSKATVAADGAVTFDAYVDAGPDTGAAYIIAVRLVDASGATVGEWDGKTLAALPSTAIRNVYPYVWASKFKTEKIGFSGQTGARDAHAAAARCDGCRRTPRAHPGVDRRGYVESRDGRQVVRSRRPLSQPARSAMRNARALA